MAEKNKTEVLKKIEDTKVENKEMVMEESMIPKLGKEKEKGIEIRELRTEGQKVYDVGNGMKRAELSMSPVCMIDKDTGCFEEIDNTLVEDEDRKHIRNRRGNFDVAFDCEEDNTELFSISNKESSITVQIAQSKKKKSKFLKRKKAKDIAESEIVSFEDLGNGVDAEYSVTSYGVKENIVIKEKSKLYRYDFDLKLKNLKYEYDKENKKVTFVDSVSREEMFVIPTPFMQDAEGKVSNEVTYEIKEEDENLLRFTVEADAKWINSEDAVLPVTIDPQINVAGNGLCTYGWSEGVMKSETLHTIGRVKNSLGANVYGRMYMNFELPVMPHNPEIKKAELVITQESSSCKCLSSSRFGLYKVSGNIAVGNSTPTTDENLIDYDMMVKTSAEDSKIKYTFDVSNLVDSMISEGVDKVGLVLKVIDESQELSDEINNNIRVYGSADSTYAPKICVTYVSAYGCQTDSGVHSHSIGRFGEASINLKSGALLFESEDFSWLGNRMPVTIKHSYNSILSDYQYSRNAVAQINSCYFTEMKIGKGWRLNIMQSISDATFYHDGTRYVGYVFIDENGKETYFKKSSKYRCTENNVSCYYLYEDVDGNEMIYDYINRTLENGGEKYTFDIEGRLIKIKDEFNNEMVIGYENGQITTIKDGVNRTFTFTYVDDYLDRIIAPDGTQIRYTYANDLLKTIVYPNGDKAEIDYESNKPTTVKLYDSTGKITYKVEYVFTADRLTQVTEYGVNETGFVMGSSSTYDYSIGARRTIVESTELKDTSLGETEDTVVKTVYTFNDDGSLASKYAYTEETGNTGIKTEGNSINPHMSENGIGVVSNINNLLKDHNFESLESWEPHITNSTDMKISQRALSKALFGKKVLYMRSLSEEIVGNGVTQTVSGLPAGQYTFSVYVSPKSHLYSAKDLKAYIKVTSATGTVLSQSEYVSMYDDEFVRIIAPFELLNTEDVTVHILLDGKGIVYAEAAQLENNPFANKYNIMEDGNFELDSVKWRKSLNASLSTDDKFNMSKSLCIYGDIDSKQNAVQTIPVQIRRTEKEVFTLSGWAKGSGLPRRERYDIEGETTFRLKAVVNYSDGEGEKPMSEEFCADFSPCTRDWQITSVQLAIDETRKAESIDVFCEYDFNNGIAYFDDIQLVKERSDADWDSNEVVDEEETEQEEYEEVNEELVQREPVFEEVIDAYGNTLTSTTYTDGEYGSMYGSYQYSTNGNDKITERDSRGNVTTYIIDNVSSRNEAVIDRCGNKTQYEYDNSGKTTKVISQDATGNSLAEVSYTYDSFDNMTEIVRGDGMKYVLGYNEFHNLANIKVDGKTTNLIEYKYKNGNGRLKEMKYANGDTMKATYNQIGQMIGEKWYDSNSSLVAYYKYVYDNSGNIVRSIDMKSLKEYSYTYEDGVLVRSLEYDIEIGTNENITSRNLVNTIRYAYDSEGKLIKKHFGISGETDKTIYYENKDNAVIAKFSAGGKLITTHSKTDSFDRKEFEEVQLGTGCISRKFSYHIGEVTPEHVSNEKVKSQATTNLVSSIEYSGGRRISYEYDAEERITKVIDTVDGITEYTYDALGQLLTEKVGEVGAETATTTVNTMTYDNYGNILTKNGIAYTYGDGQWKDLLTGYADQSITYDAQGNPTSYLGHTLTWEKGRQLKTFDNISYEYNANGIRTAKTVGGVRHEYDLEGSRIIREAWNGNVIVPLYDGEDQVCGMTYNGELFFFHKNLQGDIIAITDQTATAIARYAYDAWGKCMILSDTSGCEIATVNPFRYRGYYYDAEIGMYYLQSRFYNPEVGRFVNADKYIAANDDQSAYMLYSYCGNCPIDRCDVVGFFWKKIFNGIKKTVRKALNKTNKILVLLGVNTAAIGAYILDMDRDSSGIYHAKFDCWQQYFGYNDFYDFIFDIGTSMKSEKFQFVSNKRSYIFWAWKGNYINLGAGAELGIYCGGSSHWFVDKKLAQHMSMVVKHRGSKIISYTSKTWWITGFNPNPKYFDVKESDLKVDFSVKFTTDPLYDGFKSRWENKWKCNDKSRKASYSF